MIKNELTVAEIESILDQIDGVGYAFTHMMNDGAKYIAIVREAIAKGYKTHYETGDLKELIDLDNLKPSDKTAVEHAMEHLVVTSGCYVMVNGEKEVALEMVVSK